MFLDINYADEKMLFLESPNRFRDFEKRINASDIYSSHFLGAITEDLTGPMGSSEESGEEEDIVGELGPNAELKVKSAKSGI